MNTAEFIEKAKAIHGDKYDYSKVEYVDYHTKVCIICPEHGEFWQQPANHLIGKGCRKCAIKEASKNRRLGTEEFIKRAKTVHGDKYDYSKVEYKNNNIKVCIICPEHGEFWQKPASHLKGFGCKACTYEKRKGRLGMDTEEWIKRAREKHGDKYDYSRVVYTGNDKKVVIGCPIHGWFEQDAGVHLQGFGCQKCGGNFRPDTEYFITESKKLYPNKLYYDKCKYVNAKTNVTLYCTEKDENGVEHGYYTVNPGNHLRGTYGCKKCQYENVKRKKLKTNEQFINESKTKFGNRFQYNSCEYKGVETDITLYCTEKDENGVEHGYFKVKPDAHINMKHGGCPKCHTHQYTTESWIERAKLVHGDKYDYSKTDLNNRDEKGRVLITCPIHGDFWQTPANHLQGMGCANCTHGLTKRYKFNLLQEFESEYELRAFLENNDVNILYVILRNVEPKFEPIKTDIEKALKNIELKDPIQALEDKYAKDDEEIEETSTNAKEEEVTTVGITNVDLDDDDAISEVLDSEDDKQKETKPEPTIEDVIKNHDKEVEAVTRIEHMLTPEDREYIMEKFKNDETRIWMANREKLKKI